MQPKEGSHIANLGPDLKSKSSPNGLDCSREGQMIELVLSENLINQILNDDDLLILTDDMLGDMILMATVGIVPSEIAVRDDQPLQFEGDVLVVEALWATLAKDKQEVVKDLQQDKSNGEVEAMKFEIPQLARYLRPLYIKAYIHG